MARGVLVSAGTAVAQRKIYHCPQHHCRSEGKFAAERISGRGQNLIVIPVQLTGILKDEARCPLQGRP